MSNRWRSAASRRLRSLNALAGRRLGVRSSKVPPGEGLSDELRRLFTGLDIRCVLDVGAHHGEFAERIRLIDHRVEVVSFEPTPEAFQVLCDRAHHDDRWVVCPFAVGAVDGSATIYRHGGSGVMNSTLPLGDAAERFLPGIETGSAFESEMRTLSSIWSTLPMSGRVLLKSDVQGQDLEVLRGCGHQLDEVAAVVVETSFEPLYEGAPVIEDVIGYLRSRGFDLTGLFPVNRWAKGMRVVDFDCTFVNTRFVQS